MNNDYVIVPWTNRVSYRVFSLGGGEGEMSIKPTMKVVDGGGGLMKHVIEYNLHVYLIL